MFSELLSFFPEAFRFVFADRFPDGGTLLVGSVVVGAFGILMNQYKEAILTRVKTWLGISRNFALTSFYVVPAFVLYVNESSGSIGLDRKSAFIKC